MKDRRQHIVRTIELLPSVILAIFGVAVAFSSLFAKTTRAAGNMYWSDAVRFWAVLGFLCGLCIACVALWSAVTPRYATGAVIALLGFLWIAREATLYNQELERSIIDHPLYTEQNLARDLELVPTIAVLGSMFAGLVILSEWMLPRARRHRSSGRECATDGSKSLV